jgi:hypothetical protein
MLEMFKELQFIEDSVILGNRAILKNISVPRYRTPLVVLPEVQPKLLDLAFLASRGGVARFAKGRWGGAGGLTL